MLNTAANNIGDDKTNTLRLNYLNRDGLPQSLSDTVAVNVVEPLATLTKGATPASVQGGTNVVFTVTLANSSATDVTRAWEPDITDTLPARYQNLMLTSAALSRGPVDLSACVTILDQMITLDTEDPCLAAGERYLDPGESITLVYNANVDPAIGFEEQVVNTATATTSSLPGANGTDNAAPGAPGTSTGERNGSGGDNDLTSSDNATVTAGRPTITKTGDASLQVLQTTTMTLAVDVPVGTTNNFVITDDLPAGLRYTGTMIITPPTMNFVATNNPTPPLAGSDPIVLDFGNITNSAAGAQTITITYEVEVENILANQNTTTLVNTATLSYTGATMPLPSDTATITVIEPNLEINKTITSGAAGSDAGDTISYQLAVSNTTGSGIAYRVDLTDVLPGDLLGAPDGSGSSPFFLNITVDNAGGAVVKNAGGALVAGDAMFATTNFADDTLSWPLFDLPPGARLTITYDAVLRNDTTAGVMLANDVTALYDSLQAGGGRDGGDIANDEAAAQLDNYGETDSATVTVDASIAIQKTLNAIHSDNDFTIGDLVTFDVRVDVIEGITSNVIVTDVLPVGLDFEGPVRIVANPNVSFSGSEIAVEAPAGTLTVDLGDVTNTSDGLTDNDYLVIEIDARVLDVPGNAAGNPPLTNDASLTSAAGPAGPDTQDIDIVEPSLLVTKVPDKTQPTLGDEVTFTVTVAHSGSTADAFDVALSDVIPAGLTYVPGSHTGDGTVDESAAGNPTFDLGTITLMEMSKQFSFRSVVDPDATVGQDITNRITLGYDGQAGTPSTQRPYNTSGEGVVTPSTSAFIEAVKTVTLSSDGGTSGVVDPGDELEYTVTLENTGAHATKVVFSDPMPANTTYVGSSIVYNGVPQGDLTGDADAGDFGVSAPDTATVLIGDLAAGATVSIRFRVTVDAGTPAGTVIFNQGAVDSDQTVPEPTDQDGVDGNGDQPTDIPVGGAPPLANPLYAHKQVALVLDGDGNEFVSPDDTLGYTIVLDNRGDQALTGVSLSDTIPSGLTYVNPSAQTTEGTAGVVGNTLSWTGVDLPVGDFEVLTFEVIVDTPLFNSDGDLDNETFVNQGTADANETAPVATDGNGYPSDGNQPTSISATTGAGAGGGGTPLMDLQKRVTLLVDNDGDGLADPDDTLRYSMTLSNTGSVSATNVFINDIVPAGTTLVPGSIATSRGIVVLPSPPVTVNVGPLEPGGTASIDFRVTIDAGTEGNVLVNQALASGDNFSDETSDDNGDDGDGKNPNLTPVDGGGTPAITEPGALRKSLFASSEADSVDSDVLIGEVLTYRVAVDVPPGSLREATLGDTLPTGLRYLAGSARLARSFDTGLTASADPGGINGAGSEVFVALSDSSDLVHSGQALAVFLGDLINSDNDADAEGYTLEYQVVVENIAANQAGVDRVNAATLDYLDGLNQPRQLSPVGASVNILEPNIRVAKAVTPDTLLSSGGDVTFTLTLTNPSATGDTAVGYDVQLLDDLLGEGWDGFSVDSIIPSGGASGITDDSTANTLVDITIARFPPDARVEIQLTASAGPRPVGDQIDNTATVTYTSLPGDRGASDTTAGDPGEDSGERTGIGVGPNDYVGDDSARVLIGGVSFTKEIVNPRPRYAIGDLVEYRLSVDLPPRVVLNAVRLQDELDKGLTYEDASLSIVYPSGVGSSTDPSAFTRSEDVPAPGQEILALDLGALSNSNTGIRTVTFSYRARVDDILSNQDNQTLDNSAGLTFADPGGGPEVSLSDDRSVTLGEPHLTLVKAISGPLVGLDAGDTVSFQIDVGNDGSTAAFDVVLSDVLPVGLENIANLQVDATSGGAEIPVPTNNGNDWSTSPFDLPAGAQVSLSFDARLADSVIPGQQLQNEMLAGFTSQDGPSVFERDGATPGSEQDDDGDLDNYNESAVAQTLTVADPVQIDKRFHPDPADDTYTIGETVTYRLTISVLEGSVDALVVIDTLPPDMSFLNATVGMGNFGITTEYLAPPAQNGQVLIFNLGQVVNPANGETGDDYISIDIEARIDNVAANQDGEVRSNHAELNFTGPGGLEMREFDSDLSTPGIQGLDLRIVEPDVSIGKTVDSEAMSLGDRVTFTLELDHTAVSSADAFDLVVVDTLPVGLSYEPDSATITPAVNGQQLTFTIAALTLAQDSTRITYQARVDTDAVVEQALTNTATLAYAGQPSASGAPDNGRTGSGGVNDYTGTDQGVVTPTTDSSIEVTKSIRIVEDGGTLGQIDPLDILQYTIVLSNADEPVSNVVVSDSIPVHTTYEPGSITFNGGSRTDRADADNADFGVSYLKSVTVYSGNMLARETALITFRVQVNGRTPPGTIIANQALVDSDQTVPTPSNQVDVVVGEDGGGNSPELRAEKSVSLTDDLIAPTDGTINVGDEVTYTLVLSNTGDFPLTDLTFADTIPPEVTVTEVTNADWDGDRAVSASFSDLPVGASETIVVVGTVNAAGSIINQGDISSAQTGIVLTDGNLNPTDGDQPTRFDAVTGDDTGMPVLVMTKAVELLIDADGNRLPNAGDILRYTMTVSNQGAAPATNVILADPIPADTQVVPGSVMTTLGAVIVEDPVSVNIGTIPVGAIVTVRFNVSVDDGVPIATEIHNEAGVEAAGGVSASAEVDIRMSGLITSIPLLSNWAMLLLILLLAAAAVTNGSIRPKEADF